MPTVTDLIETVSRATRMTENEVALYARRLREAELLPKSAGRTYAEVELHHVARLLMALLVSDSARQAPARVARHAEAVEVLTAVIKDPDRLRRLDAVRVDRHTGVCIIQDRSVSSGGRLEYRAEDAPSDESASLIEIRATLPGDVVRAVATIFGDGKP